MLSGMIKYQYSIFFCDIYLEWVSENRVIFSSTMEEMIENRIIKELKNDMA